MKIGRFDDRLPTKGGFKVQFWKVNSAFILGSYVGSDNLERAVYWVKETGTGFLPSVANSGLDLVPAREKRQYIFFAYRCGGAVSQSYRSVPDGASAEAIVRSIESDSERTNGTWVLLDHKIITLEWETTP